jgi:endonuclease/exonuclease/phosphatase family metal-dependent hydrolase
VSDYQKSHTETIAGAPDVYRQSTAPLNYRSRCLFRIGTTWGMRRHCWVRIIKVISYNLRKNAARHELEALVEAWDPDVLCLQEAHTDGLPAEIGSLSLADATKANRLGLAIYYRRDRFDHQETSSFSLKKSLHDIIASPTHERLLASRLYDKKRKRDVIAACFHASPLTAANSLRRNQITAAHAAIHKLGEGLPAFMVGDYNYPLFKKGLSRHVEKNGYDLTLSDRRTYLRYKIFRGHFDFVTSQGFAIENVETLPQGVSDHLPILITAESKDL